MIVLAGLTAHLPGWPQTPHILEDGLELIFVSNQPLSAGARRVVPQHPTLNGAGDQTQGFILCDCHIVSLALSLMIKVASDF